MRRRPKLAQLARLFQLPPDATESDVVAALARSELFEDTPQKLTISAGATLADCVLELEKLIESQDVLSDSLFYEHIELGRKLKYANCLLQFLKWLLADVRKAVAEGADGRP